MIDENIKHEIESSEKEKKIRELMKTITNLKSETSFNEEIAEKREVQLNSLLSKIKSQEQEILSLKSEIYKKTHYLQHLQGEVTELRPSKDALNIVEKQSKQIEDLKKTIFSKNNEISMMKSLITSWQKHYVNHHEDSKIPFAIGSLRPGQFPKISTTKSGLLSKKSGSVNSNISKSIRIDDKKTGKDYEFNSNFLNNIIENSDDLKKLLDFEEFKIKDENRINDEIINEENRIIKEMVDEENRKNEENKIIEENRLREQVEREKIEKKLMDNQENNKKQENTKIEESQLMRKDQIERAKTIDNNKKENLRYKAKAATIIRKK